LIGYNERLSQPKGMPMSSVYPVPESVASRAHVDADEYERIYRRSISDTDGFWAEQARRLDWVKFPTKVSDVSWGLEDLHIRWFEDGLLNACYNCLDRHLEQRGEQTAIIWEGMIRKCLTLSCRQCMKVCRMANVSSNWVCSAVTR
jgi:acetyl-CoA synthetase